MATPPPDPTLDSAPRPWVRGELGFLRSGPLWRVATAARGQVEGFGRRHGFRLLELDGRRMTSRDAAHAELSRVLAFPDWYGHNWDAFSDCLRTVAAERPGERIAVLWNDFEASSRAAPATTAEVVWALLEQRHHADLTLEVFVFGDGPDFDGP